MKKLVVINTKTGEVQSVEKYVKNSSDIWVAGWIGDGGDHMMNPEQERRAMQTIFQKLDMHTGNIQNMNHRLELQENATYEFSNQLAGLDQNNINPKRIDTLEEVRKNQAELNNTFSEAWMSTNKRINQIITGVDGKILNIVDLLENLDKRVTVIENIIKSEELEGSLKYTLRELDTVIQEVHNQKIKLDNHLELEQLADAKKLRLISVGLPKQVVKKPKKQGRGRPKKGTK